MLSKDKLILDTAKKYYSEDINCYDAFLHGIEFAESLSPWISVEDDLPFKHKELLYEDLEFLSQATKLVLIRTKDNFHDVSLMYNDGHGWEWDFELDKITHWMPIPKI